MRLNQLIIAQERKVDQRIDGLFACLNEVEVFKERIDDMQELHESAKMMLRTDINKLKIDFAKYES